MTGIAVTMLYFYYYYLFTLNNYCFLLAENVVAQKSIELHIYLIW